MTLRKTLIYFLIFTSFASLFAYKIIVKAYDGDNMYDIEKLKN